MEPSVAAMLVALGAAVGFAAGLLGIGGGMLLVPFLTMIFGYQAFPHEHVVHMAVATSLTTILFTSAASVRAHHLRGVVLWRVAGLLTPGLLVGSWVGPMIGAHLPTIALASLFALFMVTSATQMLLDRKPKAARDLPGPGGMLGAGTAIGTLSGLVGAGGAFASIPFLIWCNVGIQNAVATSAALAFPIALAGTLSNVYYGSGQAGLPPGSLGFIYLPALFAVALASMAIAPLGVRAAHALDVRLLRRVLITLMYALAAYMVWKALTGGR